MADNTSHAYLYRWAEFNLTGAGGILPLSGGQVTTTYAYPANQTNNATTAALNDIQTNNTAIAAYLAYWDGLHNISSYGTSGRGGDVSLLLASNEITGSAPADGFYLGDYHVVVTVPTTVNNSAAFNWSVSAYPAGVALGTPGYATADFGPSLNFPSYFAGLHVFAVVTLAGGTPSSTVREGQLLTANITLNDTGAAPILSVNAALYYNASSETALDTVNHTVDLTALGQKYTFTVSWLVNDSVTGLQGTSFLNNFSVLVIWNDLLPQQGGGSLTDVIGVSIAPSQIKVTFTAPGSSTLVAGHAYTTPVHVVFNGTYAATVVLTARSGANSIVLAEAAIENGTGDLFWTASGLTPGTAYTLNLTATYNGKIAYSNASGTFALPAPPPPSAASFLTHKYLGVPLWIWIAIIAAILVGGFLFMRLARRTAAGKLVECGECGALIPENASVCPKCGAEFESDLVRCSRCASTIPANSKSCPECSAQLLGKPGEGTDDPERAGYEDFINRYRADGKKELGENYTEGAFWDWWKRQGTYTPFSQWKLQQGQGTARAGMTAPPAGSRVGRACPAPGPPDPCRAALGRRRASAPADSGPARRQGHERPGYASRARAGRRPEALPHLRKGDPARVPRLSVLRLGDPVGPGAQNPTGRGAKAPAARPDPRGPAIGRRRSSRPGPGYARNHFGRPPGQTLWRPAARRCRTNGRRSRARAAEGRVGPYPHAHLGGNPDPVRDRTSVRRTDDLRGPPRGGQDLRARAGAARRRRRRPSGREQPAHDGRRRGRGGPGGGRGDPRGARRVARGVPGTD